MSNEEQSADSTWIHRGFLPPLTRSQAESLIAVILTGMEGCERIEVGEALEATIRITSGRTLRVRPTVVVKSDGLGLHLLFEDVHPKDMEEAHRLHDEIIDVVPRCAWLAHEIMQQAEVA